MTEKVEITGITTTGKLRETLARAMERLMDDKDDFDHREAEALVKLAAQINKTLEADIKKEGLNSERLNKKTA